MDNEKSKLKSLSSAIAVGKTLIKQLESDRTMYEQGFNGQAESITDPRIKSLHKIVFNKNLIAYSESEKEIGLEIKKLEEELDNETQQQQHQMGTDINSKAQ